MGKLSIQEIAAVLVKKNGFKKREANEFVTQMFSLIQDRLQLEKIVKVKGLGTFKIVDVESRESVNVRTGERYLIEGHSKVSFTPDATMKELVNKPFSQFETVILNDGVEFDDMKDDEDDNSTDEEEESEITIESQIVEEPKPVEEPVKVVEPEPVIESSVEVESEVEVESQSTEVESEVEVEPEPVIEPSVEVESKPQVESEVEPQSVEIEPKVESEPAIESEKIESKVESDSVNNNSDTVLELVEVEEHNEDETSKVMSYPIKELEPKRTVEETKVMETETEPASEELEEPQDLSETESVSKFENALEPEETPASDVAPEQQNEKKSNTTMDNIDDENAKKCSRQCWFIRILGIIALVVLSGLGGYYYGTQSRLPEVVIIDDTIETVPNDTVAAVPEVVKEDSVELVDSQATSVIETKKEVDPKPEKIVPKPEPVQQEVIEEPIDKYAQKDERVRLGAYRIVGLEREVKVQPGQTFYSICRGNLGPDMSCYVEVYNDLPRDPQIKVGQIIKIPKLQLKKRRK